MAKFYANYSRTLAEIDKKKYEDKIFLCGNMDPYEMENNSFIEKDYPKVVREDLVGYLVLKTDTYSLKQVKAFKSLEAHNYLTSGLVKFVRTKVLSEEKVLVIGKVKHSQAMNETPLRVWVLCHPEGEILTGHCVCMAGLSSVCSHVAAVLFWLEVMAARNTSSCTSKDNAWLPPSISEVPITPVKDCNFSSAKKQWEELQEGGAVQPPRKRRSTFNLEDAEVSAEELLAFYNGINCDHPEATVLRVLPGFSADRKLPDVSVFKDFILTNLFDQSTVDLSLSDLLVKCQDIFNSLKITKTEANKIEELTRKQRNSSYWMGFRSGRITTSVMRPACHTNPSDPSISVLRKICYPGLSSVTTPAMKRGIALEGAALKLYCQSMEKSHQDFKIESCGLVISTDYPFIGASPNSISSCSCHGKGAVEVKCPSVDKENNLGARLDSNHLYYYQVQTQLFVLKLQHCDYVVLQPDNNIKIERIQADTVLQENIVAKSTMFFCKAVLPELVSRYFTSQRYLLEGHQGNQTVTVVCKCQQAPRVPMVNCASPTCKIITFHTKCVGLTKVSKRWRCPDC